MRDQCLEMYGCNKQSALGKAMMMGVSGQSMLMGASYLIALTKGKSQAEAFGISWAVGGALVTKFALTEADDLLKNMAARILANRAKHSCAPVASASSSSRLR